MLKRRVTNKERLRRRKRRKLRRGCEGPKEYGFVSPFHPKSGLVNWSHFHKNVSVFNTIKVGSLKMIEAKSKERKQAELPILTSSLQLHSLRTLHFFGFPVFSEFSIPLGWLSLAVATAKSASGSVKVSSNKVVPFPIRPGPSSWSLSKVQSKGKNPCSSLITEGEPLSVEG